jgi:transposase
VKNLSLDLRRRIVAAYAAKRSGTYEETAELFDVGEATVSRLLRSQRETGDVVPKKKGGNNPRVVDLEWARRHLEAHPDARLVDRVEAWEKQSGRRVSITAMWKAVLACGWTHKKRRSTRASSTGRTSRGGA